MEGLWFLIWSNVLGAGIIVLAFFIVALLTAKTLDEE